MRHWILTKIFKAKITKVFTESGKKGEIRFVYLIEL